MVSDWSRDKLGDERGRGVETDICAERCHVPMSAVWVLELNNRIELSGQSDPIALFPARGARSVLRYRAGKTEVHTCRLAIGVGTVERDDEVGIRSNGIALRD